VREYTLNVLAEFELCVCVSLRVGASHKCQTVVRECVYIVNVKILLWQKCWQKKRKDKKMYTT